MQAFSPNFTDQITTTDDVVMVLVLIGIYILAMALAEMVIEIIQIAKAHHFRRVKRKEWERMRDARRQAGDSVDGL